MTTKSRNSRPHGIDLAPPRLTQCYHEEPPLVFGNERLHVSPKLGLTLFGPRYVESETRHPESVRLGLIGSGKSIESAGRWIESCADGVPGDAANEAFPGYREDRGFFTRVLLDSAWQETITRNELAKVAGHRLLKDRFQQSVDLVIEKVSMIAQRDSPPDIVVLALPDELLEHCKTVDYRDAQLGMVHRDFRRAVKAELMRFRIPSQILLQRTTESTPESRNVDHRSKCAWNFFTGAHYKAGGSPWGPHSLPAGTCFIGVGFFYPLGDQGGNVRASIAQAFDENGEGIVLRGRDFQWDDNTRGRSPHLNEVQASELIETALVLYQRELKQTPRRVVIHKTSSFWPEERLGFERALAAVDQFDLVTITWQSQVRFLRQAKYPVLRGLQVSVGEKTYLYTGGYIPSLQKYPHGHLPTALQLAEHIGDSSTETISAEILALSKLNWNSADFGGTHPITLRFARTVGSIMREIRSDQEPLPQFKYYI